MRRVFIVGHLGLGDHIICNGIYREYAEKFEICIIPVKMQNLESMTRMLSDLNNVILLPYDNNSADISMKSDSKKFKKMGFQLLHLGYFGSNFLDRKQLRFDANFYEQANLPFDNRWEKFLYNRNYSSEIQLYMDLECDKEPYIFIHEDRKRNFEIDRSFIRSDLRIIYPDKELNNYNFFDYGFILENAVEIHCIESSFAAFVESLKLSNPKFAHRYSRPEASNDYCHEFTYRSNWIIYR